MKKLTLTIAALFLAGLTTLFAQVDPHFSQYYASPLWLNSALTGVFNGTGRVSMNVRDQWTNINNGYKTGGFSLDFRPTEKASVGFNMINQAAGTAGFNYFAAYGSFAYGIAVSSDGTKKLHFGIQAGFINRSFDQSKLQLDDQYNPTIGFDPTLPNFEHFSSNTATVFDSNVGIFYFDSNPSNKANVFAGVSVAHLNGANDPFATEGIKSTLPLRLTLHGGVKIAASDFFDITPNFVYIKQSENQIKALGVYGEFKFDDDKNLFLGGMYSINNAATAEVGYHLKSFTIGLGYDFNTSSLNNATNGQGGFELSLNYIFGKTSEGYRGTQPEF